MATTFAGDGATVTHFGQRKCSEYEVSSKPRAQSASVTTIHRTRSATVTQMEPANAPECEPGDDRKPKVRAWRTKEQWRLVDVVTLAHKIDATLAL